MSIQGDPPSYSAKLIICHYDSFPSAIGLFFFRSRRWKTTENPILRFLNR